VGSHSTTALTLVIWSIPEYLAAGVIRFNTDIEAAFYQFGFPATVENLENHGEAGFDDNTSASRRA
jgi:hypothetical protein